MKTQLKALFILVDVLIIMVAYALSPTELSLAGTGVRKLNISLDSLCYVPVVQRDADAEEALTIIMNADPIERKILMKMLRAI